MHTETHTKPIPIPALLSVQFYLTIASVATIAFGVFTAASAWPPLAFLIEPMADLILWNSAADYTARETRLLAAISGGVLAGWGVMILILSRGLLLEAPRDIGRIILISIVCWFCVDSLASVAATAPLNVLGNLIFLAAFGVPSLRLVTTSAQRGELANP